MPHRHPLRFALLLLLLAGLTSGPAVRAEYVRGDLNGWTNNQPMILDATFGNIYAVTIAATSTAATSDFKFDRIGEWSTNWGSASGSTNAVKNVSPGLAKFNGGANGNLSLGGHTNGLSYSFRLSGQSDWWDREYVVMETAAGPVTIPAVADGHLQDPATSAVPVTIQLSGAKSAQESVWVRYATNTSFSPSILLPASGSGTNYSAVLPAQAAGTRVYYYILTSTLPSNQITSNFDLCTLRGKNAGSSNFHYRAGTMNAWHFPTNAEPPGAFMRDPPTNGVPPSQTVFFYSGVQTGGVGNACNQSGLAVIHRLKGSGGWTTNVGGFNGNGGSANNAFWTSTIPAGVYGATNVVEYILRVTATDHNTTYLGTTNNGVANVLYLTESAAQAAPFSFTYGGPVANLGNCWHIPANSEPPGATMRNPAEAPSTLQKVYVYNGNQFQGAGNPGNQTGGWVYFSQLGENTWESNALVFNAESGDVGNNKYWRGEIPAGWHGPNGSVEYYFKITYSDHDTTYIGTTDGGTSSTTYATAAPGTNDADNNTFVFTYSDLEGQAAAYLWHNDNRVVLGGSNVQVWVKIGYAEGVGTNRYVDFGHIYYTTNGAAPEGGFGLASNASTRVADLTFDHMEEDSYEGGDAMWWVGTLTNLPLLTTIQYKVGAYKTTNNQERFADYGTSGTPEDTFSFALGVGGPPALTVNGVNADYTTTKFFIDEIAGESATVVATYTPGVVNLSKVEIFSNLGRRDYSDVDYTNALLSADGVPDGIKGPDGNYLTTNDVGAYYRAYPMTHTGGGVYVWTGVVSKCGAYRLTARVQTNGAAATNWLYYSSGGKRDHAVVVSPKKALDMTLYELNALTVEATSTDESGRSTFKDLLGAADGDNDGFDPFNLDYLNFIQANCLWFQPIHPAGYERAENDPGTGQPYAPGSPYASRDYWAVNGKMGADGTEATAMTEFTNFVAKCDTYTGSVGTVNVMLDGVFNHSSWDALLGQGAVDLGLRSSIGDTNTPVVSASARIGAHRPYWYADSGVSYCDQADYWNSAYDNDFAVAPDRGDFGKWNDVAEFFFGKYAALVCQNPQDNGSYLNEGDWLDPDPVYSMNPGVVEIWRYFAYYPEYWLKKTGHPGTNSFSLAQDNRGIDGLRCDFGQGLPPQMWEYIINRTRSKKWNFIFMAETLDGGVPGYRSNRHFDILNENLVFQFTQAHISDSRSLVSAVENRRTAYSGGAVLLNLTSHDEVLPSDDPWLNASRYASVSALDGLPMIFYGQEQGIINYNGSTTDDGFAFHELNFGKYVPHFKKWNQLLVWNNPTTYGGGMAQWYGRVNWARLNSPALRSRNRYFLDLLPGGGQDSRILAVAKYQTAGAPPATSDVVLAFSRFLEHDAAHSAAANTYNLQPVWGLLGLSTGKLYSVRNLAASDAQAVFTNGWPKTGSDLYNNGIYVSLDGGASNPITNDGELVQFLKLVEMNQAPVINLPGPHTLPVGSSTNFLVTASDPDGGSVTLNLTTAPTGATYIGTTFSWTAASGYAGLTSPVTFVANDNAGAANSIVTNSTTLAVPFDFDGDGISDGWEFDNFVTLTNTGAGDHDGDGQNDFNEYVAGTGPGASGSYFVVNSHVNSSGSTNRLVTVPTQPGRTYRIYFSDGAVSNNATWTAFANTNYGFGVWKETNVAAASYTFRDDEGPNTTLGAPTQRQRSYRVTVQGP